MVESDGADSGGDGGGGMNLDLSNLQKEIHTLVTCKKLLLYLINPIPHGQTIQCFCFVTLKQLLLFRVVTRIFHSPNLPY